MFGLSDREIALVHSVFLKHPNIEKVSVFGSRAMNKQQAASDIDLIAWGNFDENETRQVHDALEELPLPYFFDFKKYDAINHQPLREHIQRNAKTFYVRDEKEK